MKLSTISYDDYIIEADYSVWKALAIISFDEDSLTVIQISCVKLQNSYLLFIDL